MINKSVVSNEGILLTPLQRRMSLLKILSSLFGIFTLLGLWLIFELRDGYDQALMQASYRAVQRSQIFGQSLRTLPKPWISEELKEIIEVATHHRTQIIEDKRLAEQRREQLNPVSPEEREIRLLEDIEPGITKVNWEPDGSIKID